MNPSASITASLQESARTLDTLSRESQRIAVAAHTMLRAYQAGGKVVAFGNGGSSCDALHLVSELVGRCERDRRGLNAQALVGNPAITTALGNDYGYERTFARQVEACVERGDVVVAISTSGNSPNVLAGVRQAKRQGAVTIGLTGDSGGRLKPLVDLCICVPATRTPRIQEGHLAVIHTICEVIEAAICNGQLAPQRSPTSVSLRRRLSR
ncbi:MAG: SIS domain-containing protein [Elusimicrobia bacterium]|nr:SIS domain-containing protein [Elusimicrobiota bacterium]